VYSLLHLQRADCTVLLLPCQVNDGLIPADNFKFFSGNMGWEAGELQREIDKGAW
jgi:putative AlgH/UPF0301 family transcriptional regulator